MHRFILSCRLSKRKVGRSPALGALIVGLCGHVFAAEPQVVSLEPALTTLRGQVVVETYFGTPGGDAPVQVPVLYLDAPVTVRTLPVGPQGDAGAQSRDLHALDALQLLQWPAPATAPATASASAPAKSPAPAPTGCMRVQGTVALAHTGEHRTAAVLHVTSAQPDSGCAPSPAVRMACSARSPERFAAFWRRFRADALAGRCKALAAMADTPLQSRGVLDTDPVRALSRSAVARACPRWLAGSAGLADRDVPLAAYLRTTAAVPPLWRNGGDDQARVGRFLFIQRQGCWRWTTYYRG
jgi:hypothetical protein